MCERKHPTYIFLSASLYYTAPYCNIYDTSDLVGPVIGDGWGVANIWDTVRVVMGEGSLMSNKVYWINSGEVDFTEEEFAQLVDNLNLVT